jgi:hypothetical protein
LPELHGYSSRFSWHCYELADFLPDVTFSEGFIVAYLAIKFSDFAALVFSKAGIWILS